MMNQVNPFLDLYLAERIGEDRFVKLFSPMFVEHALPLFQTGNVILRGLQGSGKTMLLHLLKPEIRLAYYRTQEEFPVPKIFSRFIGAGINLRKSGTIHFSQMLHKNSSHRDVLELVLFFADFVNCLIVDDILQTITLFYAVEDEQFYKQVGLTSTKQALNNFAKDFAEDDCWFGAFDKVFDYASLRVKIRDRIRIYREFINLNREEVPEEIKRTKTSIGEPVLKLAEYLRKHGILDSEAKILVRIDQYEQLATLDVFEHDFGNQCQQIIHKALAARDSRVSYRIGTRHYAWPDRPMIFGTSDVLEHKRDFSITDIDETLRRKENRRVWIFPKFAADIFERRLHLAKINWLGKGDPLLRVFGAGLTPSERAEKLVKSTSSRRAIIKVEKDWPKNWVDFITKLSEKDPFSAKLGEAWCKQVQGKNKKEVMYNIPSTEPYPWIKQKYWKKERTDQALLQIASRNHQQPHWSGQDDLVGLSGGNILVFLFLCQHIWDVWLRDAALQEDNSSQFDNKIPYDIQSMGIVEASEEWRRKQREGADAKRRQNFVQNIGTHYYMTLTEDSAMSNPGKNGFSLKLEDLNNDQEIDKFLKMAVGYGDLYDGPHTSKTKGEKRHKYYLAPILCPSFKIPYTHTKEPEYLPNTNMIRQWGGFDLLPEKNGIGKIRSKSKSKPMTSKFRQGELFPVGKKK